MRRIVKEWGAWRLLAGVCLAGMMSACVVVSDDPSTDDGLGGNDGGSGGNGSGDVRNVRIAFDAQGGHFALAQDEQGNEYSFRTRTSADGSPVLSEVNTRQANGMVIKTSLDVQGRPVNFRASDNTAADLVYDQSSVRVRLTAADGAVLSDVANLEPSAARERVASRRARARPSGAAEVRQVASVLTISNGLSIYEEIALSLFIEEHNPGSPLIDSLFRDAALAVADLSSVADFDEISRADFEAGVVLDAVPPEIAALAGQTFVLFDAEGYCLKNTGVASRLTFDADGLLLTELDQSLIFADFSLGGPNPGVILNYTVATPVRLASAVNAGFDAFVTPIFTGTLVDEFGRITIERRFEATVDFDAGSFGSNVEGLYSLFDAAFVNGRLSGDGNILEFDPVLTDLGQSSATAVGGRLRYYNQNAAIPPIVFNCESGGGRVASRIICPATVLDGEFFTVQFVPGREYAGEVLSFDWFVSDGYGLILDDLQEDRVDVLAAAPGFLEVSVVVADVSTAASVTEVHRCGVNVGRVLDLVPDNPGLFLQCPLGLNVGETGLLVAFGSEATQLDAPSWFVFGTSDVYVSHPFELATEVEFFQPGKFEVAFQAFDSDGFEVYVACEILVGGAGFDECEINGYYGDGLCDQFCPTPDPDCDTFIDYCEFNGWYDDGECDDFCPEPDPDCDGAFIDVCAEEGLYGDGSCDLFCPQPDPDCAAYDPCLANDWYGDGVCDDFCEERDPDCEGLGADSCAELGYYGDGTCDENCPLPDPDCETMSFDLCADYGYYDDGVCDDFCPLPDPDCG